MAKKKKKKRGNKKETGGGYVPGQALSTNLKEVALAILEKEREIERINTVEKDNKSLKEENGALIKQLEQNKEEMKDNNEFLQHIIDTKSSEIKTLQKNLLHLREKATKNEAQYKADTDRTKRACEESLKSTHAELAELRVKLETLSEFRARKAELDAALETLKDDHKEHIAFYEDKINVLEKRLVEEKEKLKSEVAKQVQRTQARMEAKMQNELDATTKRTMEENRRMDAELRLQSKRSDEILKENRKLKGERVELVAEVEILREAQDAVLRRLHLSEKLLRAYRERDDAADAEPRESSPSLEVSHDSLKPATEMLEDALPPMTLQEARNAARDLDAVLKERKSASQELRAIAQYSSFVKFQHTPPGGSRGELSPLVRRVRVGREKKILI